MEGVFESTGSIVFYADLLDDIGGVEVSGPTTLRLYEVQADGTLKTYDFNDNTFKATACTTPTASMTARSGDNSTHPTGVWTYDLNTVTGFVAGNTYLAEVADALASPPTKRFTFVYGDDIGAAGAGLTAILNRVPDVIKNVALTNFGLPMFLTTGAAAGAALAVTVNIKKDAGAWGAATNAASATDAQGWSFIDWAAADLNADIIHYEATAVGCLPTRGTIITKA